MNPRASIHARWIHWLQASGLAFILTGLVLAEGAAAWKFLSQFGSPTFGATSVAAGVYLLLAGVALFGLRRLFRRLGPDVYPWVAAGLALLIQTGAILAANSEWDWTGDSRIFEHYLEELSAQGYAPATLENLSRFYDYRVWTRRALPFYYGLRLAAGDRFVPVVQCFQAVLIALSLVLAWRIARRFFGTRVAFWTVSFQLLMPFRGFICLDLNHHILGGFYFLAGLWILAEWLARNRRPLQTAGLALAAALLMPLMRLEGGIDRVFAGAVFLVVLLRWLAGRQAMRQTFYAALFLLILPMSVTALLLSPLDRHLARWDRHRHESGAIAFMARGWAPETGGEYCNTYETIDYLTPRADKNAMQASILASQALYNSRELILHLLPVKLAKLFLLGYASGAEEMLARNGAVRAQRWVEGARSGFLLASLPWMVLGGILILPRMRRNRLLPLVAPCVLLCAAYVLLGETSPRYSFYIQPFLFILAAQPFALPPRRRRLVFQAARAPGLLAAGTLGAGLILVAGVLAATRPALKRAALRDMRTWSVANGAKSIPVPATLAPFELQLPARRDGTGTTWGAIRIPALSPPPRFVLLYALPAAASPESRRGAPLLVETAGRTQTNSLPARIRLEYPPSGLGEIRFRSPAPLPVALRIGYATYEFAEKTTE